MKRIKVTLSKPGTRRWEKELVKALKHPNFKIKLSDKCRALDGDGNILKAQQFALLIAQ